MFRSHNSLQIDYVFISSFQLQSLPGGNSDDASISFTGPNQIVTSPAPPPVTYMCARTVDTVTGLVGISLMFSYEYNPLIQEAIDQYFVVVQNSNFAQLIRLHYDSQASLTDEVYNYCMRLLFRIIIILYCS